MKRLENLSDRLFETSMLTVKPVCSLKRAEETYNVIKNGQSLIGEEATVDLCLDALKEALEALETLQDKLAQLHGEAKAAELLGEIK